MKADDIMTFGVAIIITEITVGAGVLPVWVGVLPLFALVVYEAGRIFRGESMNASAANATTGIRVGNFEDTATTWISNLYKTQARPTPQNWNCKNCGGPNIEQVKCQYCGQVKE